MSLDVDIRKRFGAFALDVRFKATNGLTALFGRSGSGKTTVINTIAGLVAPDDGRIVVNGSPIVDTMQRLAVPQHRRRIGYVFQEGRLFPHLNVRQNLLYGQWFSSIKADASELDRIVAMLGIEALLDRRPTGLSGGEKQRVAIGRALLSNPQLLLLDEPLAALDAARKQEILPYIEMLRDSSNIPIVYVSHSVSEVARLATTIVLLSEGHVAAAGPASEILQRIDLFPLTGRAEAGAIIEAQIQSHDTISGLTTLHSKAGPWYLPKLDAAVGSRVRIRVRARDVLIAKTAPQDISALNVFPGVVTDVTHGDGGVADVKLDCSGDVVLARLTRVSVDRLGIAPGVRVHAILKSVALDRRSLSGPWRNDPVADVEITEQ
jgi:molybdate transport system ATP-binding protein